MYFAKEKADDVVRQLCDVYGDASQAGMLDIWTRNWQMYNRTLCTGDCDTGLGFQGDQGELVDMAVNESRVLIEQLTSFVTRSRLAFTPISLQSNAETLFDSKVANSLVENVVNNQHLDLLSEKLVESAAVLGAGYLHAFWNRAAGEEYAATEDEVVFTGDVEIEFLLPWDVDYDYSRPFSEQDHVRIRKKMNRWDLIAQNPQLEAEIEALPAAHEEQSNSTQFKSNTADQNDDLVWVYYWYHRPTAALPNGRLIQYSDHDTVYFDGANEYGRIPVVSAIPKPILGLPGLGYPLMSTLLPLQEMLDHQMSAIATNQSVGAIQKVLVPKGSGISVEEIDGLTFINYDKERGKPEGLNLSATATETYKFADVLTERMQLLSGLNGALRGQPPPGATSGVAIATLSANAVELNQQFSKSYVIALETLMTMVVKIYRNFATAERTVAVIGNSGNYVAQRFIGSDLNNVHAVKMKISNPMAQTPGGRLEIAQNLMGAGLIKDAQGYLNVLETGSLEELLSPARQEDTLIQAENEALARGESTIVSFLDDHSRHVLYHKSLISDPAIRAKSDIVQAVLAHISEHIEQSKALDPAVASIIDNGRLPPPTPKAPPPPAAEPVPEELQEPAVEGVAPASPIPIT